MNFFTLALVPRTHTVTPRPHLVPSSVNYLPERLKLNFQGQKTQPISVQLTDGPVVCHILSSSFACPCFFGTQRRRISYCGQLFCLARPVAHMHTITVSMIRWIRILMCLFILLNPTCIKILKIGDWEAQLGSLFVSL